MSFNFVLPDRQIVFDRHWFPADTLPSFSQTNTHKVSTETRDQAAYWQRRQLPLSHTLSVLSDPRKPSVKAHDLCLSSTWMPRDGGHWGGNERLSRGKYPSSSRWGAGVRRETLVNEGKEVCDALCDACVSETRRSKSRIFNVFELNVKMIKDYAT